jgi:hypothetical protein
MLIIVWATNEQQTLLEQGREQAYRDYPGARVVVRNPAYYDPKQLEAADAIYVSAEAPPVAICEDYARRGVEVLPIGGEPSPSSPAALQARLGEAVDEITALRLRLDLRERALTAKEEELRAVGAERDQALARVAELEAALAAVTQPKQATETEDDQPAEGNTSPRRKRG